MQERGQHPRQKWKPKTDRPPRSDSTLVSTEDQGGSSSASHSGPEKSGGGRVEQLRAVLRGEQFLPTTNAVEIVRALPHGHVLAALGTARRIEFDALLPGRASQRRRDLALALIVARLLDPAAKLATARMLDAATASDSLGEMLGLGSVTAKDVCVPHPVSWTQYCC